MTACPPPPPVPTGRRPHLRRWRVLGWVCGLVAIASQAMATSTQAIDGTWRLVGNRYKSDVELHIRDNVLHALIGCTDVGYHVDVSGDTFSAEGDLVRQAPCQMQEMRNPAAHAYWRRIQSRIDEATSFEVRDGRLTLKGAKGKLVFRRVP